MSIRTQISRVMERSSHLHQEWVIGNLLSTKLSSSLSRVKCTNKRTDCKPQGGTCQRPIGAFPFPSVTEESLCQMGTQDNPRNFNFLPFPSPPLLPMKFLPSHWNCDFSKVGDMSMAWKGVGSDVPWLFLIPSHTMLPSPPHSDLSGSRWHARYARVFSKLCCPPGYIHHWVDSYFSRTAIAMVYEEMGLCSSTIGLGL